MYYLDVLGKGMNGPLNYYRTAKFRHDEELGKLTHFYINVTSLRGYSFICRSTIESQS